MPWPAKRPPSWVAIEIFDDYHRILAENGNRKSEEGAHVPWPPRGVYFFFEEGEQRTELGQGPRVVRVGTHALNYKSGTTLWRRLSQHRGVAATGGGNHRGSIFRLIVGTALTGRDSSLAVPTWGNTADRPTRAGEVEHEQRASVVIGSMPFLWLSVDDAPAPDSLRGLVERNAIALLSNHQRPALDAASPNWLGRFCDRERVQHLGSVESTARRRALRPGLPCGVGPPSDASGSPNGGTLLRFPSIFASDVDLELAVDLDGNPMRQFGETDCRPGMLAHFRSKQFVEEIGCSIDDLRHAIEAGRRVHHAEQPH